MNISINSILLFITGIIILSSLSLCYENEAKDYNPQKIDGKLYSYKNHSFITDAEGLKVIIDSLNTTNVKSLNIISQGTEFQLNYKQLDEIKDKTKIAEFEKEKKSIKSFVISHPVYIFILIIALFYSVLYFYQMFEGM